MVIEAGKLTLGQNVHIGSRAYLNCAGGISIGDHSVLSRNVTVYSYDHNFRNPSLLPYDGDIICRPVSIGRYVWIGMNVTIAPGTVIGNGAVVGMGATVAGNIPENAIVVSAKHRVVGYRDAERVAALVEAGRYVPSWWM